MNDKGKKFRFEEIEWSSNDTQIGPDKNVVYICRLDQVIELICPCGCEEVIVLNTIKGAKPCWTFVPPNSITPSINRIVGCKSHFTITNGITH